MQVDMEHGLPSLSVAVDQGAVSRFGDAFLLGDLLCRQIEFSDQFGVLRQEVTDGTHRITVEGGAQVGLIVYGMDKDVSYGYPGGLDLEAINPIG